MTEKSDKKIEEMSPEELKSYAETLIILQPLSHDYSIQNTRDRLLKVIKRRLEGKIPDKDKEEEIL